MDALEIILLSMMLPSILLTALIHWIRASHWRKTKNKEWWHRFEGKVEESQKLRSRRHGFRREANFLLIFPLLVTGLSATGWLLARPTSLLG